MHGYKCTRLCTGTPPTAVAVPTHYFKVILAEFSDDNGDGRVAVGAFAMPNRKIPHNTPLASFAVPLELLESLTGIEFFPRAISDSQRRGLDAAAAGSIPSSLCFKSVSSESATEESAVSGL